MCDRRLPERELECLRLGTAMILLAVWTGENLINYPFSGPNVNGPCKLQTLLNRKRPLAV